MLATAQTDQDPRFFAALEAVLEILPMSKAYTGIDSKALWRPQEAISRPSTT